MLTAIAISSGRHKEDEDQGNALAWARTGSAIGEKMGGWPAHFPAVLESAGFEDVRVRAITPLE